MKTTCTKYRWKRRKQYVKDGFRLLFLIGFLLVTGCGSDDFSQADLESLEARARVIPSKSIALKLMTQGLVSPIGLVAVPDETGRLFVIDQVGLVWILNEEGERLEEPFLDLQDQMIPLNPGYDERGLLGLSFHPNYSSNGRFFVYYSTFPNAGGPGEGWNHLSRISEFSVSSLDPDKADTGSERILLEVDQPQANHNGGTIAFGPDGYLYIALGDGGGAHDIGPGHVEDWYSVNEGGNSQNIEANLLGKILRIAVDDGSPYGIPADNPFVGETGRDEIYAYGFRNPFRFSFDHSGSQELFVGDAGQHLWEEISLVENGGNYGWNVKEGMHCFDTADPRTSLGSCPDVDGYGKELKDPVIEMANSSNPEGEVTTVTIIGGNVYRGNAIPGIQGKYIFGSFSHDFGPTGEIFIANPAGKGLWSFQKIPLDGGEDDIGHYLKGFGQDLDGEIYVTASSKLGPEGDSGKVFKLTLAQRN